MKILRGFTLIELLVVISIIGILTAIGVTAFTGSRLEARDAKRLSDAREIITALQTYQAATGRYPDTSSNWVNSVSGSGTWIAGLSPNYMSKVPIDPTNIWDSKERVYHFRANGFDYCLQIPQENDASSNPNYQGNWNGVWMLRFGLKGPNVGLCI